MLQGPEDEFLYLFLLNAKYFRRVHKVTKGTLAGRFDLKVHAMGLDFPSGRLGIIAIIATATLRVVRVE